MSDLRSLLTDVYKTHQQLTAPIVEMTARDPAHPLHNRFEWNNDLAGYKYRLVQAAELIRQVEVVYAEAPDGSPRKVRAFHSVTRADITSYEPVESIAGDPFMTQLLLRQAEREWKAMQRKYAHLSEFFDQVRRDLGEAS